jgi:hypothetical protein
MGLGEEGMLSRGIVPIDTSGTEEGHSTRGATLMLLAAAG